MSLLNRIENSQKNAQHTTPAPPKAGSNQQNNSGSSRFGSRPGSGNNPFNRSSSSSSSPFSGRPSPFGRANNNQKLMNLIMPLEQTVVRFDLNGLGDPFYRLVGEEMTPDFSDVYKLALALEKGGEAVDALAEKLDMAWEGYKLDGAVMMYTPDDQALEALANPTPMPEPPRPRRPPRPKKQDDEEYEDEDDDKEEEAKNSNPHAVVRLRALDLSLTLNVLARSRRQVLLAKAPLVFGVQYINRSLVTDDPRLVALAKATGCLPDV